MARAQGVKTVNQLAEVARRPGRRRGARRCRPWLEILEARLTPDVTLSISDPVPFPKPDSGQNLGIFVVTRSGDLAPAVQVDYATQDGSGPNGAHAGIDYMATAGTLSFAPDQTTRTIAVPILGNNIFQPDKTFTVSLSNALPLAAFAPQQTFATGIHPTGVAVGDFNGDGKPDLVVANTSAATVSVLLNTTPAGSTTPSFALQQTFATGNGPIAVAVGDFNGDGKPDLAIANELSDTVSVLLNTTPAGATTASFSTQQTFATDSFPHSVAVGDVNGDRKADLVVANESSSTLSVLLNTTPPGATTASFSPQQTFATGDSPVSVALADLNGDGKPDPIVANYRSDTVSVLLNTTPTGATAASFGPQQTFATGHYPHSVAVGDLNGDGKPDLAVANYGSETVSVLLNTTAPGATTPTFAPQQTFATESRPAAVVVEDLTGDSKPELAVVNAGSDSVSVLVNTTSPGATLASFASPQTFAVGDLPVIAAVGDFNGDGKPDLAVTSFSSATVSVLLNTGLSAAIPASFAPQQTFASGGNPYGVTVADFNGDGKPDLAIADYRSYNVAVLLNTTPPGATVPSFAPPQTFYLRGRSFHLAVGDFNGDGKPDLAITTLQSFPDSVTVMLNTTPTGATTLSFAPFQTFLTGGGARAVAVGDFNGDGKPDLAVANNGGASVSVLLNTTPTGSTVASFAPQQTFATDVGPDGVAVGDFNADGKPDLALSNFVSRTVSVLLNTTVPGSTTPSFAPQQTFGVGAEPRDIAVADFNGDGKPDLAVQASSLSVLLNRTPALATAASFAPQHTVLGGGYSIAVGDLNGDGKPDLVFPANSAVGVSLDLTPAGATIPSFAPEQDFASCTVPQFVGVGDFNADGRPDLVGSCHIFGSAVSVLLNNAVVIPINGSPATGTIQEDDAPSVIAPVAGTTPQSAVVRTAFGAALAVDVRNAAGNLVQGVSVTFRASTSGPSGTFNGSTSATVVTDANGRATAPPFTANTVAGSYLVTAQAAGDGDPSTTFSLTNLPAAADHLRITTTAGNPDVAGTPFDVTVTALDPYGNTATGYTGIITFSSADPYGAALPPDYTFQPSDAGVATFPAGATLFTSGTWDVTATDTDSGISGSTHVDVVAAAASQFQVDAPDTVTPTVPFDGTVSARDPYGNLDTTYQGTVVFNTTDPDPRVVLPPAYSFTAGDAGVHTFVGGFTLFTAGDRTLTATDAGAPAITGSTVVTVSLFNPALYTPVGLNPVAVATGDFNGDGIPDVVVANSASNTIAVLLGNGDGTFRLAATYVTGLNPDAVAVADLNGDGQLDVVVANHDNNTVRVFLGNGDGTFAVGATYLTDLYPSALAVGDLNGDGIPDLVVANLGAASVSVYLGNGDGTFQTGPETFVGGLPDGVAVGDFDGDGRLDVVTANGDSSTVSVLRGNGDGSFQAPDIIRVGAGPAAVVVTDLNGDGVPDLVTANQVGNSVSVLLGNGDGTFQDRVDFDAEGSAASVALGDFNGDGQTDLAVAEPAENVVGVLPGNGDGTFGPAMSFAVGSGPAAVAVDDFNGDGAPDVLAADAASNDVAVLLNASTSPAPPARPGGGELLVPAIRLADESAGPRPMFPSQPEASPSPEPRGGEAPPRGGRVAPLLPMGRRLRLVLSPPVPAEAWAELLDAAELVSTDQVVCQSPLHIHW